MPRDTSEGVGPVLFDIPALAAGESHHIDLRNVERNGRKGWFRPHLPMDALQVTNQSAQPVRLDLNNEFSDIVVSNAVETYEDQQAEYITVTNDGSSATNDGEITVSVERTPYDADDRARDRRRQGPVSQVIENFTGIGL